MKNLFLALAFILVGTSAFAITKVDNKEISSKFNKHSFAKSKKWTYRCSDGTLVTFYCTCTQQQADVWGQAWCDSLTAN